MRSLIGKSLRRTAQPPPEEVGRDLRRLKQRGCWRCPLPGLYHYYAGEGLSGEVFSARVARVQWNRAECRSHGRFVRGPCCFASRRGARRGSRSCVWSSQGGRITRVLEKGSGVCGSRLGVRFFCEAKGKCLPEGGGRRVTSEWKLQPRLNAGGWRSSHEKERVGKGLSLNLIRRKRRNETVGT